MVLMYIPIPEREREREEKVSIKVGENVENILVHDRYKT